uniref:RNase H type-1 domain-containing protein n=1 Tax=Cannabis sativa TaxID=3483 RepID=A0A803PLD9_CANSA
MIRQLFNATNQQCIGSILLGKFSKIDSWLWYFTLDGSYSVKSSYVVASTLDLSINLLLKMCLQFGERVGISSKLVACLSCGLGEKLGRGGDRGGRLSSGGGGRLSVCNTFAPEGFDEDICAFSWLVGTESEDEGNFTVIQAEAVAIMVALDWSLGIGLPLHSIESDCLAVISAFPKRSSLCNDFGSLLDDISSLLSNYPEASLIHVRQSANMAAHELAVHAIKVDCELI